MRKPKEPRRWLYPRMYLTLNRNEDLASCYADIRIIYPDGWTERPALSFNESYRLFDLEQKNLFYICCWAYHGAIFGPASPSIQRRRMFRWAKECGINLVYIGEIK